MQPILEKSHRLDRSLYTGTVCAAFTMCVKNRMLFFTAQERFNAIEAILLQSLKTYSCEAHVYLFMPDHIHILLTGTQESSDLYTCMKNFKQKTGYWLSQCKSGAAWQKDFYDHILRKDEDITKQVKYILANPLRKNLVQNWQQYPFKGSTLYNFDTWNEI